MAQPFLKEGFLEWEININPNLKYARTELMKHGIKRYWGFDPSDNSHKLMFVQYPKINFSRADMRRILPKYKNCRLCSLGKKFIKGKNNNRTMNLSIVDFFGKIPKIGKFISRNRYMSEPILMQALATFTRYPISVALTPLGKRLVSFFVGLLGEIGVAYGIKNQIIQGEWAEYFANFITSSIEGAPKGNSVFGVSDDWRKLKGAVKRGNFAGIKSSLLNDVGSITRAVRGYGSKAKNSFKNIKRLRITENTMPPISRTKSLGGHALGVKHASDFKFTDTSHRFRQTGNFGSGFRSKRRLRESGDAQYAALMS